MWLLMIFFKHRIKLLLAQFILNDELNELNEFFLCPCLPLPTPAGKQVIPNS